jgi:hypothetical protein
MEDDPDRVEDAAGAEQDQGRRVQRLNERSQGDETHPAKRQIERERHPVEEAAAQKPTQYAGGGD